MPVYSYHPEHGKSLTAMHGHKAGDVVLLSVSSSAWSMKPGGFGFPGSQFTQYILPEPVGVDKFGADLYDLEGLGTCPLDGSRQYAGAEREAWERARREREAERLAK